MADALRLSGIARRTRTVALYDGAAQTRRTVGWTAPTASPNTGILSTLTTLRDRSREAVRNNGYAKGAIDALVSNIVGSYGIKPLSKATDPSVRTAAQQLWTQSIDELDATGQLDWYRQLGQAVRGWLEGGEVFLRLRNRFPTDGLAVPVQVEVLEPELCPHTYTTQLANGNRIRAGIEFDQIGRRVGYWMYEARPGDLQDFDPSRLRRLNAEDVIHLHDPLRPGQLRGVPQLTQALIALRELDKFLDATLLRQQLANLFVAFLKHNTTDGDASALNPLTGQTPETGPNDKPMLSMEPGIFQELEPGEDVQFSDPPEIGNAFEAFCRQQLYAIAAATGVVYEILSGDFSRTNDRTVRVILNEFRRKVMAWQELVAYQVCRRVWQRWWDRAVLIGALPVSPDAYAKNPLAYLKADWIPQGWPYIQPVQDIEAKRAAIRAGLTTRSAEVSEQGEDAEEIDAQQAADNARADGLGLSYDSDGRKAIGLNGSAPAAPAEGADGASPATPTVNVSVTPPAVHVDAAPRAGAFTFEHVERAEHHHAAPKPVAMRVRKTLTRGEQGQPLGTDEVHTPLPEQSED